MTQNHVKSLLKISVYLKGTIRRQRVEVGGKYNTDAIIFKLETCGCKKNVLLDATTGRHSNISANLNIYSNKLLKVCITCFPVMTKTGFKKLASLSL